MKNAGYVIAKNKGLTEFFTSSSAYDRPRWVSLAEATAYPTAELAAAASTKLYKSSGAYEARAVLAESLMEALPRLVPRAEQPFDDTDPEADTKMVAKDQGVVDPSIDPEAPVDDELGLADDTPAEDEGDIEDMVDKQLGDDDMVNDENMSVDDATNISDPAGVEDELSDEDELRRDSVTEAITIPTKPSSDAQPSENKTTANTMKPTPVIKYGDASTNTDKPDTDLSQGAGPHEDKVKVPANIKSELKAAIAEFEKAAKFANTRDDAKASFCMTVAEAFKELLDYLELGTVESMKLAQIHMLSWMNLITNHLPVAVQKFVIMGGRKPSLKDLFDSKREDKKSV